MNWIGEIDGTGVAEPRIVEPVRVDRPDSDRWIDPSHPGEAIVNAALERHRGKEIVNAVWLPVLLARESWAVCDCHFGRSGPNLTAPQTIA